MAKSPDERFQSAEEFRSALREVMDAPAGAAAESIATVAGQNAWQSAEPVSSGLPSQFDSPAPANPTQAQFGSAEPPPFTPVAMPTPPPVATAGPRRGLWLGLGAVIALAALVGVAWVLPRVFSTHASQKPPAAAVDSANANPTPTPAQQPDSQQPAASPEQQPTAQAAAGPAQSTASPQSSTEPSGSAPAPHHPPTAPSQGSSSHAVSQPPGPRPAYVPPAAPVAGGTPPASPAAPAGPSPAELRDARDRFANLEARADAALAGVEQIRAQQREQGLDLRGDMVAAINRLHHQLDTARQALAQKDLESANESMNRADNDTGRLEKFLGH